MTDLENIILKHKHLYYAGTPIISDSEYDALEVRLRIEQPDSPVLQVVGYNIKDGVKHTFPMLSIQKALTPADLKKWFDNTNKNNHEVILSHKIDGLAVELHYKDGLLQRAVTRGDGEKGEDVTKSVMFINEVPKQIDTQLDIRVRGEIYMKKSVFSQFKATDPTLVDPRNTAVGALKNSDPTNPKNVALSFFAYKVIINGVYFHFQYYSQELMFLEKQKFNTVPWIGAQYYDAVINEFENVEKNRESLDYKLDGVVIHINNLLLCGQLGATSHHPKYAICLKFEAEEAITTVRAIEWSMSRNGTLTPVAVFDPVVLAGATITRAKAHNLDFLFNNNINIGNSITIVRSGDVIPKIIKGDTESNKVNVVCDIIPKTCPYCGEPAKQIKEVNTAVLKCTNDDCYKKHSLKIEHFCKELGMKGFGEAVCDSMTTEGVRDIQGIWGGSATAYIDSAVIRTKLADAANAKISNTTLEDFISALGIPDFSRSSIKKWLAFDKHDKTIDYILSTPVTIKTALGDCAYASISKWLADKDNIYTLTSMWQILGITEEKPKIAKLSQITDKKVCITGTLSKSRLEFEKIITENGGICVNSISKNTNFLLCGENAGSKREKAEACGVRILTEDEFMGMVQ